MTEPVGDNDGEAINAPAEPKSSIRNLDSADTTWKNQRIAVWDGMLVADAEVRYWARLFDRYSNREKWALLLLALTSSSTVAAWGFWEKIDLVWKCLSGTSTVISIALPILNWRKLIPQLAEQRGRWMDVRSQYDLLWSKLENREAKTEFVSRELRRISKMQLRAERHDIDFPLDEKLSNKCSNDAHRARSQRPPAKPEA